MDTMNIALPENMKKFVQKQVAERGYSSVSEYVRHLIRSDQEETARNALETEILKGLQSGESTPMTREDWDVIRSEICTRHGRKPS